MAVAFFVIYYNRHGRGVRPRTYNPQSVSGEPETQSKFVLLVGFYRQTRLTTFDLFAVFPKKTCENMNPAGRGHQRCASELALSHEKTWGIWKERNYCNRLVGVRNLGMLLGASRGPPRGFWGPPEGFPELPGAPKYLVFLRFDMCFNKQRAGNIWFVASCASGFAQRKTAPARGKPVSYTHLTLPTNREV